VIAYVTGVISVRLLSPAVAGVVACLEAVIATVLAWVLLGEHLAAPQLIGGAMVLIGAFIAQSSTPKAPSGPVASGLGGGGGPDAVVEGELSARGAAT
jgi:drug/metabolite transporter (DMT)-like permease